MKIRYLVIALISLSFLSLFVGVSRITPMDLLDFKSEATEIFLISRRATTCRYSSCRSRDEYRRSHYAAAEPE